MPADYLMILDYGITSYTTTFLVLRRIRRTTRGRKKTTMMMMMEEEEERALRFRLFGPMTLMLRAKL